MALACIEELRSVVPTVTEKGEWLRSVLVQRGYRVRGRGLMLGIELDGTLAISRALLRKGFIVLPAGERAEVLGVTPPLTIDKAQLMAFVDALVEVTR
jgi:acetylornithine aminotransferase